MDLTRYFSIRLKDRRHETNQDPGGYEDQMKRSLPIFASPINEEARKALLQQSSDLEKASAHKSMTGSSSGNLLVFKKHHEASTIELFYDLYFVANLAYFTSVHQHTDAKSLINYLKLFTMLWFNWLCTTLFDVRFSIDSVWNRVHKAIQFGVFTGFVFAGPIFDKYSNSRDEMAFKNFAVVLVVSRVAIALQYAMVMWQGRMFKQTLLPLALNTGVHVLAAIGYGVTIATFPRGAIGLEEQISWVAISIAEGLSVFLIAIIWRIVSFKYTHLVERLQLLTLIIIGEGIIGMVKSVSCITKGQTSNNANEVGAVVAAVILLYFIHSLYFDVFSADRFGTVRQQLWSILHYPLHIAILLCIEGNTSLIVWNSAVQALKWIWNLEPDDYSDPAAGFDDIATYVSSLNQSMYDINARFTKPWNETYNWERNLTAIQNYTSTYGFQSDEWNAKTGNLVKYMYTNAQVFTFEAHSETLGKLNAVSSPSTSREATLAAIFDVHNVTVMQFYIGGGAMLLVLAIMYWFNKLHKTKYEFGEIINRVVIGFAMMVFGVTIVMGDKTIDGVKFRASHWLIPIVVLCFAIVLILDNLLLALARATSRRNPQYRAWGGSTPNKSNNNSTADLIPRYPPNVPLSQTNTYESFFIQPQGATSHTSLSVTTTQQRSRANTLVRPENNQSSDDVTFSYDNTPVDMLADPSRGAADLAPPPTVTRTRGKQRRGERFECNDGRDREDLVQPSMRVRIHEDA